MGAASVLENPVTAGSKAEGAGQPAAAAGSDVREQRPFVVQGSQKDHNSANHSKRAAAVAAWQQQLLLPPPLPLLLQLQQLGVG